MFAQGKRNEHSSQIMAQNDVHALMSKCPAHPLHCITIIIRSFESTYCGRKVSARCIVQVERLPIFSSYRMHPQSFGHMVKDE